MQRTKRIIFFLSIVVGSILLFKSSHLQPYDVIIPFDEVLQGPLEQQDPRLIQYIQKEVLLPPSSKPYNLSHPETTWYSENKIEPVLNLIFNKKRNGVFIEAGAFDGEQYSNTLYLEKSLGWKGLLVEAMPDNVQQLISKRRKAWVAPVCLSKSPYPVQMYFARAGMMSSNYNPDVAERTYSCLNNTEILRLTKTNDKDFEAVLSKFQCHEIPEDSLIQCLPLFSLLSAAGFTNIDFISLDVEGAEMDVLRTLPFEALNVKVFMVETNVMKEKEAFLDLMEEKGYQVVTGLGPYDLTKMLRNDYLLVKKEIVDKGAYSSES